MAYSFRIFPEHGLLLERWEGPFTVDGLWEAVQQPLVDVDYRPGLDVLADFRLAELHLSFDDMWTHISRSRGHSGLATGRNAFVVAGPREMGFGRMYEMLTEEGGVRGGLRLFYSVGEACTWLGVPAAVVLNVGHDSPDP